MAKVKRTYNLSPEAISTVKVLVAQHIASTQDAAVERAIMSLAKLVRDRRHAEAWEGAARDTSFAAEMNQLADEFAHDDEAAWDQ